MINFTIIIISILFGYLIYKPTKKELSGREYMLFAARNITLLLISAYIIYQNIILTGAVFFVFGYLCGEEKYSEYINQFVQGIVAFLFPGVFVPVKILEGTYFRFKAFYLLFFSYFLTYFIPNSFLVYSAYVLAGLSVFNVHRGAKKWKNLLIYLSEQIQKNRT